ncbi:hypothetical protein FRC10_004434 [Ceratobasidium sp. 414]|nr:hypothetical protein FRC10_004434 [Ceratobasidium sp. 414]
MADTSPTIAPELPPPNGNLDGVAVIAPTPKSARRSSWFGWPKRASNGPQRPNSALSRVVEGEVARPSGWVAPDVATPSATASTSTSTTPSPSDEHTSLFDSSPVTPVSPGNGPLFARSSPFTLPKLAPAFGSRPSSSSGLDLSMNRTYSLPAVNNTSMLTTTSPPIRPSPSPLTRQLSLSELDKKAEQLILTALARTTSRDGTPAPSVSSSPTQPTNPGVPLTPSTSISGATAGFSKKSGFGSYLGLGALSLTREKSKTGEERGRKEREEKEKEARARSSSPFRRFSLGSNAGEDSNGGRRGRSPSPGALRYTQSDVESDAGEGGLGVAPRRTAFKTKSRRGKKRAKKAAPDGAPDASEPTDDKEGAKVAGEPEATPSAPDASPADTKENPTPATDATNDDSDSDSEDSTASWGSSDSWGSGDIQFDDQTQLNTALNGTALQVSELENAQHDETLEFDSDPLGEGINVVRPEAPMFESTYMTRPSTANAASGTSGGNGDATSSRTKKKGPRHDPLELVTSRPHFATNRCTMSLTQGKPDESGREGSRYVVASDLSEESRFAVEWGIGTVLRDGDEMIVVNVQETESKLDPTDAASGDKTQKIRNQQERQTLTYLLCRQVTGLLQRTRLNVRVYCQAIHSKNSRRMLLDLIDYTEPTMVIVGSRGLNALKGILLGSTSHYLIQKSSVPVMVARRRLKRPAKRTAHLEPRERVSLDKAMIDKAGPGKAERDADATRDEIESEEASKD